MLCLANLSGPSGWLGSLFFLIWMWLALEDYRCFSVPWPGLMAGVVVGLMQAYAREYGSVDGLVWLQPLGHSLALSILIAVIGVVVSKLKQEQAMGIADPFAVFALTLPMTPFGIGMVFLLALPFGVLFFRFGTHSHIPLITVLVLASFHVVALEMLQMLLR